MAVMTKVTKATEKKQRTLQALFFLTFGIVGALVLVWVTANAENFASNNGNLPNEFHVRTVNHTGSTSSTSGATAADAEKNTASDTNDKKKDDDVGGSDISKNNNDASSSSGSCSATCDKFREEKKNDNSYFPLLKPSMLMWRAVKKRDEVIEKLRIDYGKYFDGIFLDDSATTNNNITQQTRYRPVHPMTEDGPSMDRLKRKLMIKLLKMQSNVIEKSSPTKYEGCSCSPVKKADGNTNTDKNDDYGSSGTYEQYIWATGGHSASAGHGNLYNETYTAYLERDLKAIFKEVGLDFIGRNYAMGGTSSAPTVSMCWKEIFGTDVDFFVWDYGMTDGRDVSKMVHYLYRGGISGSSSGSSSNSPNNNNNNFPAFVCFKCGGGGRGPREEAIKGLENVGFATFYSKDSDFAEMSKGYPDSAVTDVQKLPEYVRNYKCGTKVESGEPDCGKEKYTKFICPKRGKQASWHPGFKDHAKDGHGIALFMMNALISAIDDLIHHPIKDVDTLLAKLQKEENELFETIPKLDLPPRHDTIYNFEELMKATKEEENNRINMMDLVYKSPSICKPAKLPSRTRYLGYFDNDPSRVGGPAPYKLEKYDVGVARTNVEGINAFVRNNEQSITMPIVYDINKEREECGGDVVVVKPDYPDYFYTPYTAEASWTTMIFPNEAETNAYGYDPKTFKGIFFIHMQICDWGKCDKNDLKFDHYDNKKWEMKINDVPVTKFITVSNNVGVPIVGDDMYFKPADPNKGRYKIQIKVNEPGGFVRISSFVLY